MPLEMLTKAADAAGYAMVPTDDAAELIGSDRSGVDSSVNVGNASAWPPPAWTSAWRSTPARALVPMAAVTVSGRHAAALLKTAVAMMRRRATA